MKSRGLSTQPWGGPRAKNAGSGCVAADLQCLWSLAEEVQQPVAQGSAEPPLVQFADQLLRDEGVEC